MHAFARRIHQPKSGSQATKGLILDQGRRYDLSIAFMDLTLFHGQMRAFRRKTLELARLRPGEQALEVGCGTGTLALMARRAVGPTGRVAGIDPGPQQIAYARQKALRRGIPVDFQIGVIEALPFPDQTFDVVLASLMMHHLPAPLKRQGMIEMARVLKPGGRLVIADFTRKQARRGLAARFHAGGSDMRDLVSLAQDAGFADGATEAMAPWRFSAFPGAGYLTASKR